MAVAKRPGISFATACLARYLQNPSYRYHQLVDQVLVYLYQTKDYSFIFNIYPRDHGLILSVYSDAALADDHTDLKSAQGYLFKLFGTPID